MDKVMEVDLYLGVTAPHEVMPEEQKQKGDKPFREGLVARPVKDLATSVLYVHFDGTLAELVRNVADLVPYHTGEKLRFVAATDTSVAKMFAEEYDAPVVPFKTAKAEYEGTEGE